jgi:hypothetical protein
MDAPLATAWNYNAVVAAADGSLWGSPPVPPPAVITLSVVDGAAAEAGVDPGTVRFTRSGGDISQPLTVAYAVGGTAVTADDYESLSGTVTFAAGASVADLAILPVDDDAVEAAETVTVTLAAGGSYTTGATTRGTVTIASDDRPPLPVVTVSNPSLLEGNLGQRFMLFTIFLSAPSRLTVNVRWATSDGMATAGRDYVARSGLASFLPGQTRKTLAVVINGDRVAEEDETLFFNVAVARNATVSPTAGRGTGTIRNDDIPATLAAAFATFGTTTTSATTTTKKKLV